MTARRVALSIVLVALTAAAYLPLWENGFVNFDDEIYLVANPGLAHRLTLAGVGWACTNNLAPYWHPVTWLSFLLDAQFFSHHDGSGDFRLCPAAVHGQNLFWHASNAVTLFLLLLRLTGSTWRGFVAAALFALHPMHVESVAWATERKDVLSTFFGLLTVWLYARYADCPSRRRFAAILPAYALSLLAKPMLIPLPLVLLFVDYWPLGRFRRGSSVRSLVREKLPFFLMGTAAAALTLHTRETHNALVSLDTLPLSARLANALSSYSWYLSATFWPTALAALYPHPNGDWSAARAATGVACLVGLTALCLWQRNSRPWLLTGWAWFVIALLPMTGFAQGGAQAWADRFSYWPHVGLFLAISCAAADLAGRLALPWPPAGAASALVLVALGALTYRQVGCWRDSQTLWEHTLAVTADNPVAHQFLSMDLRKRGLVHRAAAHQAEAERIIRARLYRRHGRLPAPQSRVAPASKNCDHVSNSWRDGLSSVGLAKPRLSRAGSRQWTSSLETSSRWTTPRWTRPTGVLSSLMRPMQRWAYSPVIETSSCNSRSIPAS